MLHNKSLALLIVVCFALPLAVSCDDTSKEASTTASETKDKDEDKDGAKNDDDDDKKKKRRRRRRADADEDKEDKKDDAASKKDDAPTSAPTSKPDTTGNSENKTDDPDKGGAPFKGPATKAIVGTWDLKLDATSLPKDLPGLDQVKDSARGEMSFDGEEAEVKILGQKRKLPYKVTKDEGNVLEIELQKSSRGKITITFTDHDSIKMKEAKQPGVMLGSRKN